MSLYASPYSLGTLFLKPIGVILHWLRQLSEHGGQRYIFLMRRRIICLLLSSQSRVLPRPSLLPFIFGMGLVGKRPSLNQHLFFPSMGVGKVPKRLRHNDKEMNCGAIIYQGCRIKEPLSIYVPVYS